MVANKKTVRRIKRAMPKPKQESGFDPRLVALGAGAGAVYGRATNSRRATQRIAKDTAAETKWNIENLRGLDIPTMTNRAALDVLQNEYGSMPRAKNQGAVDLYENLRRAGNDTGSARKMAGLSQGDFNKLYAKKGAKTDMIGNNTTAGRMKQAARIRAKRTNRSATVKGAISGAALATLAQLIAKELNKK